MKNHLRTAVVSLGLLVSTPALAAEAEMIDSAGESIGKVTLSNTSKGVLLDANLFLPPGDYAFHIHEKGDCRHKAGEGHFKYSGGHFNPEKVEHGYYSETGPHAGDMPNLHVTKSGFVHTEIFNPQVTLDKDSAYSLLDADGTAILIHQGTDDYRSQPSGAAGKRIACGVIRTD